jgi:outer membrane protein assembly factor BamB
MDPVVISKPARRFRLSGFWSYVAVFMLGAGIITLLWSGLVALERPMQWASTYFVILLIAVIQALWILVVSGLRWFWRLGLLAAQAAGLVALVLFIADLRFTGDMRMVVRWKWEVDPEKAVAEHRRQQRQSRSEKTVTVPVANGLDFAEYRGRKRDGVVAPWPLARQWKSDLHDAPKLLWKQPCGLGWSSFAIVGNLAVTVEQRQQSEVVACYDISDGRELWTYEHQARFNEPLGGVGPRATPTIVRDAVYSLGATGHLACLELATGNKKWSAEILEDGNPNLEWAMSGSPLVYDQFVVVNPGNQLDDGKPRALAAYDRETGKKLWSSGTTKAGYSSPMLATFAGLRQIVLLDGKQVGGYDANDGKLLWSYAWDKTNRDINVAQPIVDEVKGRVFISSGYNIGCAMLQIEPLGSAWQAKQLWKKDNKPLRCRFTSPVEHDGFLYGLDEGVLACIDANDGSLKWRDGRYGHGQLLRCDDLLLVTSDRGDLALVDAKPEAFRELGRIRAIQGSRCWNVPAFSNGKILVRNEIEMACFELPGR